MAEVSTHWDDDLLERRENAQFLYNLVIQKYKKYHSKEGSSALCFALDADWGAGKSFFIDRWSKDVEIFEHPTIHFDAWANDLSDDPLIGFLASLKRELQPWIDRKPLEPKIRANIQLKFNNVLQQAKTAAFPAIGTLLAGLATRYAGQAFKELPEIWNEAGQKSDYSETAKETDASNEPEVGAGPNPKMDAAISKSVDKFFESALKTHTNKQQAIGNLKKSLEDLIDYLQQQQLISPPFFIFIDELDRCRPDYAIRLLEGMKHLFNARGVCFVVSTNLKQLSSSVKAVYGSEFDAYRYLKKFFSFEYSLPTPDYLPYARSLMKGSILEEGVRSQWYDAVSGLPDHYSGKSALEQCAVSFSLIAAALDLNPRSQRQVFEHAEASLAGLERGGSLLLLYNFFLAAVLHQGIHIFDRLFVNGISNGSIPSSIAIAHIELPLEIFVDGSHGQEVVTLRTVLENFHVIAGTERHILAQEAKNHELLSYPRKCLKRLTASKWMWQGKEYIGIAKAGRLTRASGYMK